MLMSGCIKGIYARLRGKCSARCTRAADLRTGHATAWPASQPVEVYTVRIEGEDILVGLLIDQPLEVVSSALVQVHHAMLPVCLHDANERLRICVMTMDNTNVHAVAMKPASYGHGTISCRALRMRRASLPRAAA